MSPQPWTKHDDAIMREKYPQGGPKLCLELLTTRSPSSISARASRLGLYYRGPYEDKNYTAHYEYWATIAMKPPHLKAIEPFTLQWFDACNSAFVAAMREHYPELEVKL